MQCKGNTRVLGADGLANLFMTDWKIDIKSLSGSAMAQHREEMQKLMDYEFRRVMLGQTVLPASVMDQRVNYSRSYTDYVQAGCYGNSCQCKWRSRKMYDPNYPGIQFDVYDTVLKEMEYELRAKGVQGELKHQMYVNEHGSAVVEMWTERHGPLNCVVDEAEELVENELADMLEDLEECEEVWGEGDYEILAQWANELERTGGLMSKAREQLESWHGRIFAAKMSCQYCGTSSCNGICIVSEEVQNEDPMFPPF